MDISKVVMKRSEHAQKLRIFLIHIQLKFFIVCGLICTQNIDGTWVYARVIVKINHVYEKIGGAYEFPYEPFEGQDAKEWEKYDECWKPINKMLDFIEANRKLLSDWRESDDSDQSDDLDQSDDSDQSDDDL